MAARGAERESSAPTRDGKRLGSPGVKKQRRRASWFGPRRRDLLGYAPARLHQASPSPEPHIFLHPRTGSLGGSATQPRRTKLMGTNPEITQHYPKQLALDETLVQTGPQFLRLKPGGVPQIRQVPLRLMGARDKAKILEFAHTL